jgi:Zn-dependent protease
MSTENQAAPRRQSVAWALVSSILLAGWLFYLGGWIMALAGVFGILVHEFGHYLAINRAGLGPSRIYLVPFLGGMATQPRPSPDDLTAVVIALAGPALGIVATLPFFAAHAITGSQIWLLGALIIAIINLFNLIPAPPLDGSKALGPVLARVHPQLERVVVIGLGILAVIWAVDRGSYLLALVVGLVLLPAMMGRALRLPARPLDAPEMRKAISLYLGVLSLCLVAIAAVGYAAGLANPFVLILRFFQ